MTVRNLVPNIMTGVCWKWMMDIGGWGLQNTVLYHLWIVRIRFLGPFRINFWSYAWAITSTAPFSKISISIVPWAFLRNLHISRVVLDLSFLPQPSALLQMVLQIEKGHDRRVTGWWFMWHLLNIEMEDLATLAISLNSVITPPSATIKTTFVKICFHQELLFVIRTCSLIGKCTAT